VGDLSSLSPASPRCGGGRTYVLIRFAAQSVDYLGAGSRLPLLHFWSLGVEEQFYLFWPLVVLVALRLMVPSRLGWLVGALAVVSFASAFIWTDIAAPWAFFSLPTRAWQLGVGAIIAIGLIRLPDRTPGTARSLLGWAGLGLIGAAVVLIGPATPYPGMAALLPVLGTALVILAGSGGRSQPSRLLGMAIPRFLGRISYSLYLWHWPLSSSCPSRSGLTPRLTSSGGCRCVVAALSTELIETPIRQGRLLPLPPRRSLVVAGAASVLVAVGALGAGALVLDPERPGAIASGDQTSVGGLGRPLLAGPVPADLTPALADAYYDLPDGYRDGCHLDYATVEPPDCLYGPPDGR
jgi:peptidoglycan/LPS O-acetylase OafA/YrhL